MKNFTVGGFIVLGIIFIVKAIAAGFGISFGLAAHLFELSDIMNAIMYGSLAVAMFIIHLWAGESFRFSLIIKGDSDKSSADDPK